MNIHGLAAGGVHAGRIANWTVEDVRVVANGSVGWDGDLWDAHGGSNSGTLTFRHWTVEWNGCGETYPGRQPTGCWAQSAGGYGDGFATGTSGGRWIIEDSSIRYNTSDGLDFLYVSAPGSSVTIRRTIAEGNAGNQIKTYRGPFTPIDAWYSAAMNATGRAYVNKTGTTQFRLRFAIDDNNNIADYMQFFSGDAATVDDRPQLVIQYYVPARRPGASRTTRLTLTNPPR